MRVVAFPIILQTDPADNPWARKFGLSSRRIAGAVTALTEDAEGNRFTPDRQNWLQFLRDGYLDIDHAYFHPPHLEAAIIGVPAEVRLYDDHVVVVFALVNRPDVEAIYQFISDHPNLLGYSIAGPLRKGLFEASGDWTIVSVALTHAPINPNSNAVALSQSRFGQIVRTAQALGRLRDRPETYDDWRQWFGRAGWDPVDAHALAMWSTATEIWKTLDLSPHAPTQALLDNLLVDPRDLTDITRAIRDHLDQYRRTHPGDPHLQPDGRFLSVGDAIQCLKYCQHHTKEQVAHILGVIRANPAFIVHPPGFPVTQTPDLA